MKTQALAMKVNPLVCELLLYHSDLWMQTPGEDPNNTSAALDSIY